MVYSHGQQPTLLLLSRFSRDQLCVTLWTAAHQAPLSSGFSRQEYWSGLPFPPPMQPMATGQIHSADCKQCLR